MPRDIRLLRTLLLILADGGQPDASEPRVAYHLRLMGEEYGNARWISRNRLTTEGRRIAALWRDNDAFSVVIAFLETQRLPCTPGLISEILATFDLSPLFAARIRAGLLQREVADRAGLNTATVCRCERLNRLPQSRVARESYARALGLTTETLADLYRTRGSDWTEAVRRRSLALGARLVGKAHRRVSCPQRSAADGRKGGRS